ncbi:toll/interleukin-1 receptor domain-containing protein [Mesorhizobium sp. M0115]|uniref:toll/interleukin-1 receptor domain-containing protein n=1 Tax=Mesorhizobium sp. M0115 TaxID=2956883 RepID=UPI00333AE189
MIRDTVFISHATPDDNMFVRWLGARLSGHGYRVWADLFELKGGTPFWVTIEEALRQRAIKVIFVVSRQSVDPARSGVRNELSVADALKKSLRDPDFIIPVRVDDVPFGEFPIQVHQLNAIDFSRDWGARFIELLDTLEAANVPRNQNDRTAEFEAWRDGFASKAVFVEQAEERVLTNWLPIAALPSSVNFYEYAGSEDVIRKALQGAGLPHRPFHRLIISFLDLASLQSSMLPSNTLLFRAQVPLADFLSGKTAAVTSPRAADARNIATHLLREHVESHLVSRGLKRYETSSGAAYYFPKGLVTNDKVAYLAASGKAARKNVVGRSERHKVFWHLAMKVNLTLGETPFVRFKPYICFSEEGLAAIADAKKTSAIRRRFCMNWWNKHWRQLQQAFCAFLVADGQNIPISLGAQGLVLNGSLLELPAARRMSDDLALLEPEDAEDPAESEIDEYGDDDFLLEEADEDASEAAG